MTVRYHASAVMVRFRTSRSGRALAVLGALLLTASVVLVIAGCTTVSPVHVAAITRWYEITHGSTPAGAAWAAYAREHDGQLCISITGSGGPTGSTQYESGCDDFKCPDAPCGQTYLGAGPGGSMFVFGVVPTQVAGVKAPSVDGHAQPSLSVYRLPAHVGLPEAKLWVWAGTFDQFNALDTTAELLPLNSKGKSITIPNFP